MADSCTPLSWLACQGTACPPVQAADIHTSASSPVSRARMLCCTCQRAPTDTILENFQFTRFPNQPSLYHIWQTWQPAWLNVAVFPFDWHARAVPAPHSRLDTVTPPPPLLVSMPTCCAADAHALPLTPVAFRNYKGTKWWILYL